MTDLSDVLANDEHLAEWREVLWSYRSLSAVNIDPLLIRAASDKRAAVVGESQMHASIFWCIETILKAQQLYLNAFADMRAKRFYSAWCLLEKAEIQLTWLGRHLLKPMTRSSVEYLRSHVPRLQSLFPYRLFFSPAFTKVRESCSICGTRVSLRGGCQHRPLELYDGELCGRRVEESKIIEVSIVTNPVQKYSVLGLQAEKFNYGAVYYIATALRSPWDHWDRNVSVGRRIRPEYDRPELKKAHPNQRCPCGAAEKFKRCCKKAMIEEFEHVSFVLERPPDVGYLSQVSFEVVHGSDDPTAQPP